MIKRGNLIFAIFIVVLFILNYTVVAQEKNVGSVSFKMIDGKLNVDKQEGNVPFLRESKDGLDIFTFGASKLKVNSKDLLGDKLFQESIITNLLIKSDGDKNIAIIKFSEKGKERELNLPLVPGQMIELSRYKGGKFDSIDVKIYSNDVMGSYEELRNKNENLIGRFGKVHKEDEPKKGILFARFEAVPLTVLASGVYAEDLDEAIKEGQLGGQMAVSSNKKNELNVVEVTDGAKVKRDNAIGKDKEQLGVDLKPKPDKDKLSSIKENSENLKPKKRVKRVESIQEAAEKLEVKDISKLKNIGKGDENIFTIYSGDISQLAGVKAGKLKIIKEEIDGGVGYKTEGTFSSSQVKDLANEIAREADENGDGLIDKKEYLRIQRKIYTEVTGGGIKEQTPTTILPLQKQSETPKPRPNVIQNVEKPIRVPTTFDPNPRSREQISRIVNQLVGKTSAEKIGSDLLLTLQINPKSEEDLFNDQFMRDQILIKADKNKDGVVTLDEVRELQKIIDQKYR